MLPTDLRNIPIPLFKGVVDSSDYRATPVNLSNALASEELVRVTEFQIASESLYLSRQNVDGSRQFSGALEDVWCRASVASRLATVNVTLRKYGVELLVADGYRPLDLQWQLWFHFLEKARAQPGLLTELDREKFALRYCSDPRGFNIQDSKTWPTHITGGAVDVTIRDVLSRTRIWMGSDLDEPTDESSTDFFEKSTSKQENGVKEYRRLLFHAMTHAGFTNYPNEWWHFDWGNQMWAFFSVKEPRIAHYGVALFASSGACDR
jgi:zinc D-Ala-D-Ala dipeptidase